jgi:hypothetical protein
VIFASSLLVANFATKRRSGESALGSFEVFVSVIGAGEQRNLKIKFQDFEVALVIWWLGK